MFQELTSETGAASDLLSILQLSRINLVAQLPEKRANDIVLDLGCDNAEVNGVHVLLRSTELFICPRCRRYQATLADKLCSRCADVLLADL